MSVLADPDVAILGKDAQPWVATEMSTQHGAGVGVELQRGQRRGRVQTVKQPAGRKAGAGAKFQRRRAGARRGQRSKQGSHFRIRSHAEADACRIGSDGRQ
jgi:hypothetical protein